MVRSLRMIFSLILTGMLLIFPLLSVHAESAADSSQLNTSERLGGIQRHQKAGGGHLLAAILTGYSQHSVVHDL